MPASKIIRYDQLSYYHQKLVNYLNSNYAEISDIPVVPSTVSSFTNDANYQSGAQVTTAINAAIAGISGISFEIVQTLPATGDPGTIYLVPAGQSATGDIYAEWIYLNSSWEKLGTTAVDLTGMVSYDSTNEEFSADNSVIAEYATNLDIDSIFA